MSNLWRIAASDKTSLRNIAKTISRPISPERLQKAGIPADVRGLYAWGSRPGNRNDGNWGRMYKGDTCLFYAMDQEDTEKAYRWVADVKETRRSAEIAQAFWDDPSFSLIYFLDRPLQIDVSVEKFVDALSEFATFETKGPRGFQRVRPQVVGQVTQKYGSIRRWIDEKLLDDSQNAYGRYSSVLETAQESLEQIRYFNPKDLDDARERVVRAVVQRQGQGPFREQLIDAYDGRCAITGCDAIPALEAAHITPYMEGGLYELTNGLLLRCDIHTLFDLELIAIDPACRTVALTSQLQSTCYGQLEGKKVVSPRNRADAPSDSALRERWSRFKRASV